MEFTKIQVVLYKTYFGYRIASVTNDKFLWYIIVINLSIIKQRKR